MNRPGNRHSSLFLIELIAAIFFFCLAGAVCIRLFVKSHTLSQDTRALDMAVSEASSAAEYFLAGNTCPDGTLAQAGQVFTAYYDEDFTPCKEGEGAFTLTMSFTAKGDFTAAKIQVKRIADGKILYTLEPETYHSEKGGRS